MARKGDRFVNDNGEVYFEAKTKELADEIETLNELAAVYEKLRDRIRELLYKE